jgi:hypothetical protein
MPGTSVKEQVAQALNTFEVSVNALQVSERLLFL